MKEYHYYDNEGNITKSTDADEAIKKKSCCLKIVSDEEPGNPHLYIKMDGQGLYDPGEKHVSKSILRRWAFKHVRAEAFDLYTRYLTSKHHNLFLNAQRVI